jgi:ATP-dependent Clp protease protease subunit
MARAELDDLSSLLESSANRHLFQNRTIVLSEGIGPDVARRIIGQLLAFDALDPEKPITMYLNSPGGEVSSGFAIFDTMRFIRPEVRVVVTGLAASIATVILLGAKKKYRLSLPNSRILIHQPLIPGAVQGQASDLEITAREIVKTREKLAVLYNQETGQPLERIQRDIERDYWMTAKEAQEYGLITRVITDRKELE